MPTRRVDAAELRRIFNGARYFERMMEGEFHAVIVSKTRRRRGDRHVRDTVSQTVEYWDKFGRRVAVVHQFRKKDGTLGASGRPDPKFVLHEGIRYALAEHEDWDIPNWEDD